MTVFRIADWEQHYETAETRKLESLRWVPTPNRHDGLGFRRLAAHRDRCELFAAWTLILQVASRGRKGERGILSRDGQPLDAEDLALMTGFPSPIFSKALEFFSHPKQGWLVATKPADVPSDSASAIGQPGGSPDVPAESPARPADAPALPGLSPAEWKGMERREGKGMEEKDIVLSPAQPADDRGKSQLQLRVEKLHRKRPSTPWDRSEVIAWRTAQKSVEATTDTEWSALELFT